MVQLEVLLSSRNASMAAKCLVHLVNTSPSTPSSSLAESAVGALRNGKQVASIKELLRLLEALTSKGCKLSRKQLLACVEVLTLHLYQSAPTERAQMRIPQAAPSARAPRQRRAMSDTSSSEADEGHPQMKAIKLREASLKALKALAEVRPHALKASS
jgi:hypothetical protein